jgi:hypothetical protein
MIAMPVIVPPAVTTKDTKDTKKRIERRDR